MNSTFFLDTSQSRRRRSRREAAAPSCTSNPKIGFLTASFLSSKLLLPRAQYVAVVVFLCVLFFWLEVVHRVAENRAMERCEDVELFVRGGTPTYGGPLIGKSLAQPNSLRDQLEAADNLRIYLPYLVLIIGAISIAVLAPVATRSRRLHR